MLTVSKLSAILDKLKEQGHGNKPVTIDKSSLYSPFEADGCYIMGLHAVGQPRSLNKFDEDGFRLTTDGHRHSMYAIVLSGCSGAPGSYEREDKVYERHQR